MKIKDIRKVRDFYKTNIKNTQDTHRNPHFAGSKTKTEGATQFGFFEMFNGPGDIDNKLATILNIAGDSQAIYEFMQNAVDADSTYFYLAKFGAVDKPYLIVLNNGDYFTLQSIISILAIGVSSKYRNPDNIGQFGVGFKLAHRLIGADNSLKELLEENKGPILFSWANNELRELPDAESFEMDDPLCSGFEEEAISKSTEPWLFKIIATNFPCLHNDEVLDARGRSTKSLFTTEDFAVLKNAAKECLAQFEEATRFATGTLLVIPLHSEKVKHVIGTVPKGLEVASKIISSRAKKQHDLITQIEGETLQPADLISERWELPEVEVAGKLGNEQAKDVELMFLYGDPFKNNPFKGKPQFYRYFPMSLEQHGFRFAIHSNALTLSSARTELQENDSNKFLFRELTVLLERQFNEYIISDTNKFCKLYGTILLSQRSEGDYSAWLQGRNWLEDSLWIPLIEVLQKNTPVKVQGGLQKASNGATVLIKNSSLPIEKWYRVGNVEWFYWENTKQGIECCYEAQRKLQLNVVSLLDILINTESILSINEWLTESPQNAHELLYELNNLNTEDYDKSVIWKNFNALRLWWFENSAYSIDLLGKEESLKYFLINYGPLDKIKDSLSKVQISISSLYLNQYPNIYRTIRENAKGILRYLFNYEELNKHLSNRFIQSEDLNREDKINIFNSIETSVRNSANASARRIDTMKPLALFSDKRREIKPLFQLTSFQSVPEMLQGWRISEGETNTLNLKDYLADSREVIYEHIVKPFWNDISNQQEQNSVQREALFSFSKSSFELKPTMGNLPADEIFFAEDGTRENQFYHQTLSSLSENDYKLLASLLSRFQISLPQHSLLPFYSKAPFQLPPAVYFEIDKIQQPLPKTEAQVFVSWLVNSFPDIAKSRIYQEAEDDQVLILPKSSLLHNYISERDSIAEYIRTHHSTSLIALPDSLKGIINEDILQEEKLLKRLIHEVKNGKGDIKSLLQILFSYGNDDLKRELLLQSGSIDITFLVEKGSFEYSLLRLCFLIENTKLVSETLNEILIVKQEQKLVPLKEIENKGSDILTIDSPRWGKLNFSINELLGGLQNTINQQLTEAAKHWEQIGISSYDQISTALGIHSRRKTDGIWNQFLAIINDGRIRNGQQLGYISVMAEMHPISKTELFVETLNGWQKLEGTFYLNPISFIPSGKTLSTCYSNLPTVVNFTRDVLDAKRWKLQSEPYFKEDVWVMYDVSEIPKDNQADFCSYLYKQWEANNKAGKIELKDSSQKWSSLLGFSASEYILSEQYSLPEEKAPLDMFLSYGIPESKLFQFLVSLGAQDENNPVVRTRKFFRKDNGKIETGITPAQTVATLKWLCVNRITARSENILVFYGNLVGRWNNLLYFPAFAEDYSKFKIVDLTSNPCFISKTDLELVRSNKITLQELEQAARTSVINIANLTEWANYLTLKIKPVEIKWRETDWDLIRNEACEWNFHFYQTWQMKYPQYHIFSLANNIPKRVLANSVSIKGFRDNRPVISNSSTIYFGNNSTERLLFELKDENVFTEQAKSDLKAFFEAETEEFEKYIELAKKDSGFAKLLKERAEAIKLQEELTAKADTIRNIDNKYSFIWFLNLLDFVRTREQSATIPEITFFKCERLPSADKIFELSESNGNIPSNVDAFDEIPATITYVNDKGESVGLSTKIVASEKHRKLWVMFPEVNVQSTLENARKIVSVKLEFTRSIDLIDELKKGFTRLGVGNEINLKDTLSPNIDFIYGPPGTGKTTELASRLLKRSATGSRGPIIILTPTNKAADVLAKKIIQLHDGAAPDWLARIGNCTDPLLLEKKVVKKSSEVIIKSDSDVVLITTIHRFCYFMVPVSATTSDKARLCDCPWKEVIFDEASMIPLVYIVHAIYARQLKDKDTHFLVAGDPLQIPPVFDLIAEELEEVTEELQQENIYSMVGLKSFDKEIQSQIPVYGNRILNLTSQHRSIPSIGDLFSKFQYGGTIIHTRGTPQNSKPGISKELPLPFAALGFKPITIIRYPVKSGDSLFKPQKLEGSPVHLYSSLLVSELIKHFAACKEDDVPWSVGVLAPYRSQADVLLKMIEANTGNTRNMTITTDTVHGFQGDENNIVFAVFNPSGNGDNISFSRFLKKEFIINVAISRAEDYLVLLIPDDNSKGLYGLPLLNQLMQLCKETKPDLLSVMHSEQLEEQLMGQKNYFESKSFSTTHQKVNIYGRPELPYMIRINEKSLDVHWEV